MASLCVNVGPGRNFFLTSLSGNRRVNIEGGGRGGTSGMRSAQQSLPLQLFYPSTVFPIHISVRSMLLRALAGPTLIPFNIEVGAGGNIFSRPLALRPYFLVRALPSSAVPGTFTRTPEKKRVRK